MADHRKVFDRELLTLKQQLLTMGEHVEQAIDKAIKALISQDLTLADEVIIHDDAINQMRADIDNMVIQIITQQQPVAKDLRRVIIALKMNASLERMGDLARNIAKISKRLEMTLSDKTVDKLMEMVSIVQEMVRGILQAYLDENEANAKLVAIEDDKVDTYYKNYLNYLFSAVDNNVKSAEQATQLAFVGRHLERIGDHVTNIAELLVYLEEAKNFDLNK